MATNQHDVDVLFMKLIFAFKIKCFHCTHVQLIYLAGLFLSIDLLTH